MWKGPNKLVPSLSQLLTCQKSIQFLQVNVVFPVFPFGFTTGNLYCDKSLQSGKLMFLWICSCAVQRNLSSELISILSHFIPSTGFWETHPSSKFYGKTFCSFCVILLTNQASNQMTQLSWMKTWPLLWWHLHFKVHQCQNLGSVNGAH